MTSMKYPDLMKELNRIANLSDPAECQESLRELLSPKGRIVIESQPSGNFVYFYLMKRFYNAKILNIDRKIVDRLGKIPIEEYQSNKEKYDSFSLEDLEELKKILMPVRKKMK